MQLQNRATVANIQDSVFRISFIEMLHLIETPLPVFIFCASALSTSPYRYGLLNFG